MDDVAGAGEATTDGELEVEVWGAFHTLGLAGVTHLAHAYAPPHLFVGIGAETVLECTRSHPELFRCFHDAHLAGVGSGRDVFRE